MTVLTFPETSRFPKATNVVDATAGAETIYVSPAAETVPGTEVTVVKSDASANAVTVAESGASSLAVLEAQNDATTVVCDGAAWAIKSNSSSSDVSTHAALTEAHGAAGVVQGADDLASSLAFAAAGQIPDISIDEIMDSFGNPIMQFAAGGAVAVNKWIVTNSIAASPIELGADGTDTDIDIVINAKGAGVMDVVAAELRENATAVALSTADIVDDADDSVEVVSPTVAEFNALVAVVNDLLAACRTARVLDVP
jgi:hypothetical protein